LCVGLPTIDNSLPEKTADTLHVYEKNIGTKSNAKGASKENSKASIDHTPAVFIMHM
jgi:hypothetical protein